MDYPITVIAHVIWLQMINTAEKRQTLTPNDDEPAHIVNHNTCRQLAPSSRGI